MTGAMQRLASGFGLLEGARWYPETGLVFSDMTLGGVYRWEPEASRPEVVLPHRKGIGGLVAHADGGFVVSGRNLARKTPEGGTEVLLATATDEVFFNDLTALPDGRLLAGSVAVDPLHDGPLVGRAGRLYRIDLDGKVAVLFDDVMVSNGIGVSPDAARVYHVDTGRKVIWAIGGDEMRRREPFVDTAPYPGEPDGLAVAEDGSVWVAMAGGGIVLGWDRTGRQISEIAVPQPLVTSVCFGGADRRSLYILTGPTTTDADDAGGSVYVVPANVTGLASPVSRTRIADRPT